MTSLKRRDFLKLCIGSAPALVFAHAWGAESGGQTIAASTRKPENVDRYIDLLPIPKVLRPENESNAGPLYRLGMTEFTQPLHSQLPPTRMWGYAGQFPGPTIEAERGKPLSIEWENRLPAEHLFRIDQRVPGAAQPAPAVRTAPHLHGGRVASASNPLPEQWFGTGQTLHAQYPNNQAAAALWYHDRAAGIARLNVYAGFSGLYLLRDDEERKANLPSGPYEIPLLLRDCSLDAHGQLVYAATFDDGQTTPPGTVGSRVPGRLPAGERRALSVARGRAAHLSAARGERSEPEVLSALPQPREEPDRGSDARCPSRKLEATADSCPRQPSCTSFCSRRASAPICWSIFRPMRESR